MKTISISITFSSYILIMSPQTAPETDAERRIKIMWKRKGSFFA